MIGPIKVAAPWNKRSIPNAFESFFKPIKSIISKLVKVTYAPYKINFMKFSLT